MEEEAIKMLMKMVADNRGESSEDQFRIVMSLSITSIAISLKRIADAFGETDV
jgi:hypothetical protein